MSCHFLTAPSVVPSRGLGDKQWRPFVDEVNRSDQRAPCCGKNYTAWLSQQFIDKQLQSCSEIVIYGTQEMHKYLEYSSAVFLHLEAKLLVMIAPKCATHVSGLTGLLDSQSSL